MTPCKPYKTARDKDGYSLLWRGRKKYLAHRYFYEQAYGKTDSALDHLCRNRWCIVVEHLEPVTNAENTRRGDSAKLTYADVELIKSMYAARKLRQWEIGKMFGVGQDQISRIVTGKRWRVA